MSAARLAAWIVLLVLAAGQAWMLRHAMSPDGVAYLDLSDAIVHGRPAQLVNAYWSPIYPALIGIVRVLTLATPLGDVAHEFALVHLVNFGAFVLALASFDWLLSEIDRSSVGWEQSPMRTPWARIAAYVLFGTTTLAMISLAATTPDMLLAAIVFAAFACLLRLERKPTSRGAVVLGILLAAGALTKSFLFPLGVLMLASLALVRRDRPGRAASLRAAGIFALLTIPWCMAVSRDVGHASFGETGRLNYAWYVNGAQPPNSGVLPALAQSHEQLPVAGVAVMPGARGTNPLWYDPARWHRDVHARFSFVAQAQRLWSSLRYYAYILAPLLIAAAMIAGSTDLGASRVAARRAALLLVPSMAALGAYALVYTTSRFLAPFVVAPCILLAAAFPATAAVKPGRLAIATGAALFAVAALSPMRSRVLLAYAMALTLASWFVWGVMVRSVWVRFTMAMATSAAVFLLLAQLTTAVVLAALPIVLAPILWIAVSLLRNTAPNRIRAAVALAAIATFAIPGFSAGVLALIRGPLGAPSNSGSPWETAQRMVQGGAAVGSGIAVVGDPDAAVWARLARYHIVAVVPESRADDYRRLGAEDLARMQRAFAAAGAMRVIDLGAVPRGRPGSPARYPQP